MRKKSPKFSPEVRERAVRMVFEHAEDHASQWAAISRSRRRSAARPRRCASGCGRPSATGQTAGPTTAERQRIKELEREVRELRQANEILRKASAYFAQAELDRPFKK